VARRQEDQRVTALPNKLPALRFACGIAGPTAGDMDAAKRIVAAWNAAIPTGRVRIINQDRLIAIRCAMRMLGDKEIIETIRFYGGQKWQRQKGAWKTFLNFLASNTLAEWYEKMCDARERAESATPPADARVARTVSEIAKAATARTRTIGL